MTQPNRELTAAEAEAVHRLHAEGLSPKAIARRLGIDHFTSLVRSELGIGIYHPTPLELARAKQRMRAKALRAKADQEMGHARFSECKERGCRVILLGPRRGRY